MNNPAAEQRGISKCIERPKGRGITPGEIKIQSISIVTNLKRSAHEHMTKKIGG